MRLSGNPVTRRNVLLGAVALAGAAGCAPNGSTSTSSGDAGSLGPSPAAGSGSSSAQPTSSSGGSSPAETAAVTLYSGADTNIQQLWQKSLIPAFMDKFPQYPVKFVFSEHGTNDTQESARLAASIKTGNSPPADIFDTGFVTTAASGGQLVDVSADNVSNLADVKAPLLTPVKGAAVPYRGSSVLLAYNSKAVTDPPKTLADLLAWIKAHPGKFAYNSPSTGGSGGAFVATVLDSTTPQAARETLTSAADPAALKAAEQSWDPGWAILHGLNKYVYQHVYPNGNQAVLELLGKGQIDIAPVWSDQYLTAVANHQLGPQIKVTQISDPSFTGGAAYLGIPKNSTNKPGALALANFVLEPAQQAAIVTTIAGFPAIPVSMLPKSAQARLVGADANNLRPGFSSEAGNDMNRLWQSKVPG